MALCGHWCPNNYEAVALKERPLRLKVILVKGAAMAVFSTASLVNAAPVGTNDIDDAVFITMPFVEVLDTTGFLPNADETESNDYWPEDVCEDGGGGYVHYKYKPTEDQMINIVASARDTEIRVINADNDTCLHEQDDDNLNYWEGDETNGDGVFVPETDGDGNYIPASDDDSDYVGEAPHWYQRYYLSDYNSCGHGCSEDSEDQITLTANTTYIIQIASYGVGRDDPSDDYEAEYDNRGPTFVSMAVGGQGAAASRPPPPVPVPTLPLFGLGILVSLLGFFGLRKLRT